MVGKWHLGNDKGQSPWEQGFDYTQMIGKNGLDYSNYSIYIDSNQNEFTDDGVGRILETLLEKGLLEKILTIFHPFSG